MLMEFDLAQSFLENKTINFMGWRTSISFEDKYIIDLAGY